MSSTRTDLQIILGPLKLKNPIVASAGTVGYGLEFQEFFALSELGALITKTLTLEPRAGNPAPRVVETPAGMLNAVGLQNIGIEAFQKEKWPALTKAGVPVIVSLAGFTVEEFEALARRAAAIPAAAFELNLSCPNVSHGAGARCFAQNPEDTSRVVRAAKAALRAPVIAKLSPEVADLPAIAKAAREAGADALTLINTLAGMAIDVDTARPVLANGTGGMSGPAIRPLAVRCIWETFKATGAPILGAGGVLSGRDAIELMMAGACAVSVGTASFWDPRAPIKILHDLSKQLNQRGVNARDLIGKAQSSSQ